jgi:hypothetical protein
MINAQLTNRKPQRRSRKSAGGFTLIEAALTTVIISTGVLAILAAQQAFHKKSDWAQRTGTGLLLANELRELTIYLPKHDPTTGTETLGKEPNELTIADFDDIDDFAGTVDLNTLIGTGLEFRPPINALRLEIEDMEKWSQRVDVVNVLPDNISSTFTQPIGTTELMRVTVSVFYHPTQNNPVAGEAKIELDPVLVTSLSWVIGDE